MNSDQGASRRPLVHRRGAHHAHPPASRPASPSASRPESQASCSGSEKGEVLLRGVGTLPYFSPPDASVPWQPDGLTIHTKKWFPGTGFLGAPPISLSGSQLTLWRQPFPAARPAGESELCATPGCRRALSPAVPPLDSLRGNHLSNTTCLMQAFFKRVE